MLPDALDPDQRKMYDAIVDGPRGQGVVAESGSLQGPFDPLLRTPVAGNLLQELGAHLRFGADLRGDLRELVILLVARDWRCGFEWTVHSRTAVAEGVPQETIDALRAGESPVFADSTQQLLHDATLELFASRRLSDPTFAAVRDTLGENQVAEFIVVVGYYSLLAMILESFEIGARTWEQP